MSGADTRTTNITLDILANERFYKDDRRRQY